MAGKSSTFDLKVGRVTQIIVNGQEALLLAVERKDGKMLIRVQMPEGAELKHTRKAVATSRHIA
jgi:hypothetical protein